MALDIQNISKVVGMNSLKFNIMFFLLSRFQHFLRGHISKGREKGENEN